MGGKLPSILATGLLNGVLGPLDLPMLQSHEQYFSNLLDICILIYLNDILIYSKNAIDYEKHVYEVLLHLQNNKLYAHTDKCSFH